ncbi:MAG: AraC-like DNA-binding protein [Myxococcota bacterium]|jgi:AraC-like DNA-binding protein
MVEAAERRAVDRAQLLADHQLTEVTLADPDARLPVPQVNALWLDAIDRSGEPELPVHAALELPWGAYRVIDYLCANAETLGDAVQLLSTVFAIVNDSVRVSVERTQVGGGTMRVHHAMGGDIPSMYADYALTACAYRMRWVVGGDAYPTRVELRRSAPAVGTAHQLAFGPNVRFDQDRDAAIYDAQAWSRPALTPNPGLRDVLHRHADAIIADLPAVAPLIEQIRAVLTEGLPHGRSELARVAKALDTSPRTLQRRLSAVGVVWSDLVGETRFALARAHLAAGELAIEEIGLLVGYSDHSSFHRAFVRWCGQTPGAWRSTH